MTVREVGRDVLDLLDEALDFVREYALVLLAAAGAMLLAYGFALTTFSVSMDEDTRFLGDRTFIWWEQGRPVVALVKYVIGDTLPLPFYNLALSLLFLFVGGALWAFLFTHAARLPYRRRAAMLVFLVVFLTIPINAYWLTFGNLNIASGLAVIWSAGGAWCAWLWAVERRGWPWFAGAIVLAFLAAGTYQAYAFMTLAGVLVAQLASLLLRRPDRQPRFGEALRESARLVLPMVIVLGLALVVNYVLVPRGGYTEETYLAWGEESVGDIVRDLGRWVGSYLIGRGFAGGWLLIPTVVAAAILVGIVGWRGWQRRSWYPLLLLLVVLALPFALSTALGSPLPNRALKVLPLVAASVWLLLALAVPSGRVVTAGLLGAALLFAIWNGNANTRLFLAEQATYEADLRTASAIMERLEQQGWDGERLPLVVAGRRIGGPAERVEVDETFGRGFFWLGKGNRAASFMQAFGFPVRMPTPAQRAAGLELAGSMPDWPASGSVVLEDGLAVVRFGEPVP